MTPAGERQFEAKAEKEFRGHRGLQNGRDFRWNCFRFRDEDEAFKQRYDIAFPDAPGGKKWFDRFCPRCGKLPAWCECEGK